MEMVLQLLRLGGSMHLYLGIMAGELETVI